MCIDNRFGCLLQGGFIRKRPDWKQVGKPFLLSVEDAQQPGKDIGSGTFHIRSIQQLLAACASTLHQCQAKHAQREAPVRREASAWAAVQVGHVCPTTAVFLVMRCPTVAVFLVNVPDQHCSVAISCVCIYDVSVVGKACPACTARGSIAAGS